MREDMAGNEEGGEGCEREAERDEKEEGREGLARMVGRRDRGWWGGCK